MIAGRGIGNVLSNNHLHSGTSWITNVVKSNSIFYAFNSNVKPPLCQIASIHHHHFGTFDRVSQNTVLSPNSN